MTNEYVSEFAMYGCRDAMAAGLSHIDKQVAAIERAVAEEPNLAFDLARTLVESTCRSILTERQIVFEKRDDLPQLFKQVTQSMPLLPPEASADAEARRNVERTLSGLYSTLEGLCRLRNAQGLASHGSGVAKAPMTAVQALLAAQAADAIVGFLHGVHCGERPVVEKRLEYDDNPDFNAYIDETNGPFFAFDLEYLASEALFNVDQEAYRDQLANFIVDSTDVGDDEVAATATDPTLVRT